MSTEIVVNRVSQEPPSGYSEEQIAKQSETGVHPDFQFNRYPELVKPAGAPTDLVEDNPEAEKTTGVRTAVGESAVDLSELFEEIKAQHQKSTPIKPDAVDLVEFQEFKRQVLATFKHLGVDVRKHFTD